MLPRKNINFLSGKSLGPNCRTTDTHVSTYEQEGYVRTVRIYPPGMVRHQEKTIRNITARDIQLQSTGRLWVSDITYSRTDYGFAYLPPITDAYSKKIAGRCLWPDLTSTGTLNALKMAVKRETTTDKLIHRSDRGIQYCCHDYVNYLKGSNIRISMTENGDPYENAIAERVNGILKDEHDLYDTFPDFKKGT